MRNELQHIEQIEKYLNQEMTAAEKQSFENAISQNQALAEQVNTQQLLMQAAVRKAIKADIAKYGAGATSGFNWMKWLGGTAGVTIIAIVSYFLLTSNKPVISEEGNTETPVHHEIEATTSVTEEPVFSKLEATDTVESAASDSITVQDQNHERKFNYAEDTECGGLKTWVAPEKQKSMVDPKKGATIEGKDGTLIIVPSDAFVDKEGKLITEEVELELIEALKVSDMVAYNLTTMSDDTPLSSGGMIYIQPKVDGEDVFINSERPLYIEIPTDEYNSEMKSWEGKVDENGDINWQNPKELEKYLTKVDFELLDFLPNGFEAAVIAGMPFKTYKNADKKLVDSLYYSLGILSENLNSASKLKDFDCDAYDNVNLFDGKLIDGKADNSFISTLLDERDNPIIGATFEFRIMDQVYASGITDESGKINAYYLLEGDYQIKVCYNGITRYYSNIPVQDKGNFNSFNQLTFQLYDRDVNNLACNKYDGENFYQGVELLKLGEVFFATNVLHQDGSPVTNATCDIVNGNKIISSTTTGNNGWATFENVPAGKYQLKICDNEYVSYANGVDMRKSTDGNVIYIQDDYSGTIKTTNLIIEASKESKTKSNVQNQIKTYKLSEDIAPVDLANGAECPTCSISPQSVQTIKSDAFANTFLATKEFEQRIKVLHQMPNAQKLFDLYVNNLSMKLWEVDEMVAAQLNGTDQKYFNEFASEKLTNVKDASIYQEQLTAYYNKKQKEYLAAAKKTNDIYQKQSLEDLNKYQYELSKLKSQYSELNAAQNKIGNNNISTSGSTSQTSANTAIVSPPSKKKNFNLPKLNLPVPTKSLPKTNTVTAPSTYSTKWFKGGWMNIDAYLHELEKGNKTVEIEVKDGKGKIYQCINTLKTIIPLTVAGIIAKAKFPTKTSTYAAKMNNTFAIGIRKENGQLQYAEKFYNPYQTSKISLDWINISSAELKEKLKVLDGTTPLIQEIELQEKFIQQQLEIQQKKEELDQEKKKVAAEMNGIEEKIKNEQLKLAKERAFISSLEAVINKCGVSFPIKANVIESESANSDEWSTFQEQALVPVLQNSDGIFEVAEVMPEFTGGKEEMYKYLSSNIVYPPDAFSKNIQGKVYIQFVVDKKGNITQPTVLKSVHPLLDQEAIRVISQMPPWTPGSNKGKVVKVRYTLPINFMLDGSQEAE